MYVQVRHLSGDGHDDMVKGGQVVRVAHPATAPGYVDVKPRPLGHTHPVRSSVLRGGEEGAVVVAVEGDVKDAKESSTHTHAVEVSVTQHYTA